MSERACLALLLDGPLQSWGFASRFQRRTTGLYPTKSGVVGMISAAMGLAKGSPEESVWLPRLAALKMTSITVPRQGGPAGQPRRRMLLRLEDFHATGGGYDKATQPQFIPRRAAGGPCANPTLSYRQYLLEARFIVLLEGERETVERAAGGLRNPVWGVWFGRKSCLPAAPVLAGVFDGAAPAWAELERKLELHDNGPLESYTRVSDAPDFAAGDDTLNDRPISFGDGESSGPGARRFAPRRIRIEPGLTGASG
jgi:CRISPR system Cascade subunit CasD